MYILPNLGNILINVMQYFKKELLSKINSDDRKQREDAEKEWEENCKLYSQKFNEIKKRLPRRFMKAFLSRNGLHDYTFLKICVEGKKKGRYSCKLQLTNSSEIVSIAMINLVSAQIDITTFSSCILGKLSWGYCEFDLTPAKNIQLSLICDIENEMRFEFQSIRISAQQV